MTKPARRQRQGEVRGFKWTLTPRIGRDEEILDISLHLDGFDMAFNRKALGRHIHIVLKQVAEEVIKALETRRGRIES